MEYTCPQCHARLDENLLSQAESGECPFCGAELPESLVATVRATAADEQQWASPAAGPGEAERLAATLPPKSRIQVIEATGDRLLVYIPAGGSKRTLTLGLFAAFWNGFVVLLCSVFFGQAFVGGGGGLDLLFLVPFFGLFALVGLVMLGFWFVLRFSRFFVLAEPDLFSLQRAIGNRKKTKTVGSPAGGRLRACLVESYRENDVPVYAVCVRGEGGEVKFGTALRREEKAWLVERLNEFWGGGVGSQPAKRCPKCGSEVPEVPEDVAVLECPECGTKFEPATPSVSGATTVELPDPLAPENLPPDSPIRVEQATPEALVFTVPLLRGKAPRVFVPLFLGLFGLVWVVFFLRELWVNWKGPMGFTLFAAAVTGVLALGGVVVFFLALSVSRMGLRLRVAREGVQYTWGGGLVKVGGRVDLSALKSVALVDLSELQAVGNAPVRAGQPTGRLVCVLQTDTKRIPLAALGGTELARQIGGLIRYQLRLLDAPVP